LVDKTWPAVVAHRGASATNPENTLPAFEAAVSAGADVIELDVRLTADEVPVVLHDHDLSRTTDGRGSVHELTLAQLKRLDASAGRGPRIEIPALREVLEALAGRAVINLELKNIPGEPAFDSPREAVAEGAVRIIEELDLEDEVLLSSFNWLTIERVRDLNPRLATGFLTIGAIDPGAALVYVASRGHAFVIPQAPAVLDAGRPFVHACHRRKVRVGTWTVDDPDQIEAMFRLGVDAVATNAPDVAVPIRDLIRAERGALGQG
jgi:glycerophosphoryl diester phosphodiesterase